MNCHPAAFGYQHVVFLIALLSISPHHQELQVRSKTA
jgi:hypothetical protein